MYSDFFNWLAPILTIIGLISSLFTTLYILNKQIHLQINRERLDFVYFPLVTAMHSYNGDSKSFDLYWYLSNKIHDEKYITLLGCKEIIYLYKDLEEYYSSGSTISDSDRVNNLYDKLESSIEIQYIKLKRKTGLASEYFKYAFWFFIFLNFPCYQLNYQI